MLTTLEAYSSWQSAPLLPLGARGPETDLIQIRNIEGLGPAKANVNTVPFGSVDGSSYVGGLVETRNIVITVGLNPDWDAWSMEALRRLLYAYFMPKQRVRLVFNSSDDLPAVEITGYTETVEPSLFSKDGEFVVSILCPDPYFTAVEPTLVTGFFTNGQGWHDIQYDGNIETGINVKVLEQVGPAPSSIKIQMVNATDSYFTTVASVNASKYFVMNSLPGAKYAQNVELGSGVITNLLPKVDSGSKWLTVQPGHNRFIVVTDAGTQDWELTYFERFGGL